METEEILFITFREDLKRLVDKWRAIFDIVSYSNVPVADANAMIALERVLQSVDYKIPCEK